MKKLITVFLILAHTAASFGQNHTDKIQNLVIRNVSVVPMNTENVLHNQDVVIRDGKIISISDSKSTHHKNSVVIEGAGKYMMPSLADAHVHFPKEEVDMKKLMELYLINGVTKLRSMRGDWQHPEWRMKYNTDGSIYPKLYLSAPPISRNFEMSVSQIQEYVKTAKAKGFDFIKILSVKDKTTFAQLDSICKNYNMRIGGHFPSNINDSLIFNSNYSSFEHLGGLTGDPDLAEKRLELIKANAIFLCPTLSWYDIGSGRYSYDALRKLPGMEFIPNAIVEEWLDGTKSYREKLGDVAYQKEVADELKSLQEKYNVIKRAHQLGIPMLLSPDSSSKYMISGFGMVGEMELLKHADLSNYEILRMATVNFSKFFNEDNGTIEVGKTADFILLNADPLTDLQALTKIEGLYFNNQFLDIKKLDAIRSGLLKTVQN